jgi:hypothetical protein
VDLYKTIRDLLEERKRLDSLIHRLETMQRAEVEKARKEPPKRRGRKQMSESERREVSERMRRYWADRRKDAQGETGLPEALERTGT